MEPRKPQPECPDFYSRRKSEDSAKDYASSLFDVFLSFFGGVVTTRVVSITRKCLKK